MSNTVDNLAKYGSSFQSKVIRALLTDGSLLRTVHDLVNPNFFENDSNKWIVGEILKYFQQYGKPPTIDVFVVKCKDLDQVDKILNVSVKQQLKNVFVTLTNEDVDFVRDEFTSFCRNQNLKQVILKSVDLLKGGQYEKIKELVDAALQAGLNNEVGHNYLDDFEERYTDISRTGIPTGWDVIDDLMDGGPDKGELCVVVAPSGAGKTWALCVIGANAMKRGKRVVHYSLELNDKYVGKRYDTILTGIPTKDLKDRKDEVENKLKTITGNCEIIYEPPKSITVLNIRAEIEKLINKGERPDVIIIDYADLLKSYSSKSDSTYEEQGGVYIDLRALAGELGIPIWTASQTNRDGIDAEIIGANKIADSYAKVMNADFIMSVSRKSNDKLNNTGRVHVVKNRMGQDGMTFPCKIDTTHGIMEIYNGKSSNGIMATKAAGNDTLHKQLLHKKFVENFG